MLLLLDGHASHVKNFDVIDLARANEVVIICLSPHCTHKLQPLDVGFMKPLSECYTHQVNKYQRQGNKVTMKNVFSLFGKAFAEAAKIDTAIKAFGTTGIYPFNPDIFSSSDFVDLDADSSALNLTVLTSIGASKFEKYVQLKHLNCYTYFYFLFHLQNHKLK